MGTLEPCASSSPAPTFEMPRITLPPEPDPRLDAATTLRRLVTFVAAALDSRYAFVAAFDRGGPERAAQSVTLWLARDYGLSSELTRLALPDDDPALRVDYVRMLRRVWPNGPELARMTADHCVAVPLLDPNGRLLGHLGLADRGPGSRVEQRERLHPLARRAATEVQRWSRESDSRE